MIENLAPDAADDPFAAGAHPGRYRSVLDHAQLFILEDVIERLAVFAGTVPQQEAQGLHTRSEVGYQIPHPLHRPVPRRIGGDAGDVQAPGAVFEFVLVRSMSDLDDELRAWLQESHDTVGLRHGLPSGNGRA